MKFGALPLPIDLPGSANALHEAGRTLELIRDLAANYDRYHHFLAGEVARVGDPHPLDYPNDFEGFMRDGRYLHDLLQTETVLRFCADLRSGGREEAEAGSKLPLVGADQRLLSRAQARTPLDTTFGGPPIPTDMPI